MTIIIDNRDGGDGVDLPAEIARLARLDPVTYEATRKTEADSLNVRVAKLDKFVTQRRRELGMEDEDSIGSIFRSVPPSPDPVELGRVLDNVVDLLHKYAVLPDDAAPAVALWIAHTYVLDVAYFTPRLAILSAEKGSGKSTVLDLLGQLCPRALQVANITSAAMFRIVESEQPTLLIDEADTFVKESEDLRGILNAGHKRGSPVLRVQGDAHEVRAFQTFAPVALAGIGDCLPDTVRDRSIIVNMRRALPEEKVARLRLDRPEELHEVAAQLARFALDSADLLSQLDPEIPSELFNRAADNWRLLITIADLAGDHWPQTARRIAVALSQTGHASSDGVMLLEDMLTLFSDRQAQWMNSEDIVGYLSTMEDRPWPEFRNGKPISARQLATLLKPYCITPDKVRLGGRAGVRGYHLADFEDAWQRYIPGFIRHTATAL